MPKNFIAGIRIPYILFLAFGSTFILLAALSGLATLFATGDVWYLVQFLVFGAIAGVAAWEARDEILLYLEENKSSEGV